MSVSNGRGIVADGLRTLFSRPQSREPVVDGIRALAILWVLLVHVLFFQLDLFPEEAEALLNGGFTKWIGQGAYGVDMFFVISGYLIGGILLKEQKATGTIHLRRFYGRRFLRLIPVYLVAMLAAVYFMRGAFGDPTGNVESVWANLLYVNNYLPVQQQYMPWCWSLAIEEQFYLLAPLALIWWMKHPTSAAKWMLAFLAASGLIRLAAIVWFDLHPPFSTQTDESWFFRFDTIYDKTHMRFGGLLAGVFGAFLTLHQGERVKKFFSSTIRCNLVCLSCVFVFICLACTSLNDDWILSLPKFGQQLVYSHHRDVFSLSVLGIILVTTHGSGMSVSGTRWLLSARIWFPIAQLSYSAYLLHEMFMVWGFPRTAEWIQARWSVENTALMWINGVISTTVTLIGSAFLFVLVERPCMRMRQSAWFKRLTCDATDSGQIDDSELVPTGIRETHPE